MRLTQIHTLIHSHTHTHTHTHTYPYTCKYAVRMRNNLATLRHEAALKCRLVGSSRSAPAATHRQKERETQRERGSETATETDERAIYCFSYLFALEYCLKCDLPLRRRLRRRRPCSPSDSQGRCSLGGSGGTLGELLEQLSSGKSPLPAACWLLPAACSYQVFRRLSFGQPNC